MSARQWTREQAAAIEDRGGALLVSAAAGSGKTAVLVERTVQMIARADAPVSADRLLILTFTNAAADELRSRVGARLEEEIRRRPADAALRRQRLLLRRAFVGTIDAFCQQLVREHFIRLDLPPEVMVGDGALLQQLSAQALAETMEEMYADADFARFAALYGQARSDAPAEQAILGLYGFTRSLPAPDAQLENFAAMYESGHGIAESPWGRELMAHARDALEAALRLAQENRRAALADSGLEVYLQTLEKDDESLENLLTQLATREWDAAYRAVEGFAFAPLKACRTGDPQTRQEVKNNRDNIKKIFDHISKYCFVCTEVEFQQDCAAAAPLVGALVRATLRYSERYMQLKLDDRVLDFSDFEHLAHRLLQGADGARTDVARQVSDRYDAVMVDEYQDTNALQSALYTCLGRADGGNLFYVGDVKQSIYRFRSANPEIFLEKKHRWAPFESGQHPATLTLGHNFRSGGAVIDGVNHLFGLLMSPAVGDVDYGGAERLIPGGQTPDAGDEGFEVCLVETDDDGSEAAYIAERIAQMVQTGAPVWDGQAVRPCGYGDFCVLLRARGRMPQLVAALEARGIPVAADLAEGLLGAPEVLPLVAALCAIDNPGDDVNLAAAMLGPLFRFTADELALLRAGAPGGRLWGAVVAAQDEKTRDFVAQLGRYRALAVQMPAGRLCEELVGRTGYLSAVAAMDSGAGRRDNLLRFIAWAGEVAAAGRGGLAGFVRLLQAGAEPSRGPAKPVAGHVNLLTIHKSKGLEFPICFLADTTRQFNRGDLYARVQMHAQLGVGLALRAGDALYPTLPALAIRGRAAKEGLSEEMRVLYVALTRAQRRLIITVPHARPAELLAAAVGFARAPDGRPDPFMLGRARNMAAWVLAAAVRHPDIVLPGTLPDVGEPWDVMGTGHFTLRVVRPDGAQAAEKQAFRLTAQPDAEVVVRLRAGFGCSPPRAALAQLPVKVSVSALAGKGEATLLKRPSFMYRSGLTAAERGTAQHAFMQYADFSAARRDLEGEIARLVQAGFLTAELAGALDRKGTGVFLASPLAARVAAAEQVYREYDFLTGIPAGQLQPGLPSPLADEEVLVQGIADLVLVGDGQVEIVDYKTDRDADADELVRRYQGQLALYQQAVQKRLGLPVTRLTIWAFALGCEVGV